MTATRRHAAIAAADMVEFLSVVGLPMVSPCSGSPSTHLSK
jgi:hypothetical protein